MTLDPPLLLASSNAHKLDEVREILAPAGIQIVGLSDVGCDVEPPDEDQPDFLGNARKKALHYAKATGRLCLADDSGLVVDALEGRPGVHSARYAGVEGDRRRVDAANNAKLLAELDELHLTDEQRTARFVCVMVVADAQRERLHVQGEVRGRIMVAPAGSNGFGYDPLFYVPQLGLTAAQMTAAQKNQISHRAAACRKLVDAWRQTGGASQ